MIFIDNQAEYAAPRRAFIHASPANDRFTRRAVDAADFRGKRGKQLDLPGVAPFDRVILIGIGTDPVTPRLLEDVGGLAGQVAAKSIARRIDLLWDGKEADAGAHLAFGAALGQYRFTLYRKRPADSRVVGEGELIIRSHAGNAAGANFESQWRPVSRAVRFARDLITEPANEVYPERFVERARKAFDGQLARDRS